MSKKLLEALRASSAGWEGEGASRSCPVSCYKEASKSILSRDGRSRSIQEVAGSFKSILCRVGRSSSRQERSRKLLEASRPSQEGLKEEEQAGTVQEVAKSFKSILNRDGRRRSRQELSRKLLEASRASSAVWEGAGAGAGRRGPGSC